MPDPVVGSLRINLLANLAEFREGMGEATKQLKRFERNFDKVGRNLQSIGTRLSIGVTAPLALFARKSINAARDAEELQSAFDFSFGEMSKRMNEFARTTGDALGRSTQQLQEQAFTFNQLFKTALDPQAAADLSQQFTLLTNDLSSFFNVAEGDALQKLRAGLVGEAEPLRAFGVFLSAAAVQAKAFELGLGDATGALTEQEKILARAAIILEQTQDAQGDLLRTQGSFANQQRTLNAEIEELSVIVGQELLPPLTELLKFLVEGIQKFRELDPQVQSNVIRMSALAAAVGPGLIALGSLIRLVAFASRGLGIFVTVSKTAEGAVKGLRLNVLGAVAAFATLAPAANAAGDAIGDFLARDRDFIAGLALIRARLPKALGGLGLDAQTAQRVVGKAIANQFDQVSESADNAAESMDRLRDSSLAALDSQLNAVQDDAAIGLQLPDIPTLDEILDSAGASDTVQDLKTDVDAYSAAIKSAASDTEDFASSFGAIGEGQDSPIEKINDGLRDSSAGIARAVAGLESFEDVAKRIGVALIESLAIQPFITSLQNFLTGGSSGGPVGGIFGALFGGFLAGGGPVIPNRAFVVGEQGPELFVPRTSGQVIPNNRMAGMGGVVVNQTIVAEDPNAFRASRRQQARMIRRELGIT